MTGSGNPVHNTADKFGKLRIMNTTTNSPHFLLSHARLLSLEQFLERRTNVIFSQNKYAKIFVYITVFFTQKFDLAAGWRTV